MKDFEILLKKNNVFQCRMCKEIPDGKIVSYKIGICTIWG